MGNKFDDLFNDFFNHRKSLKSHVNDDISKIIKALQNYKNNMLSETFGEAMEQQLGEPDHIEETIEDGFLFKKLIWDTPKGQFVKIVVMNAVNPDGNPESIEDQLKKQLQDALDIENYELAVELRDKIKNIKNENNPKRSRNSKGSK